MKKILFVCVENSNHSQMAEAFAIIHGKEKAEAFSAGSRPSGVVNPKAVVAMAEVGHDLTQHFSRSVNDFEGEQFDHVITMGCGDKCPFIPARQREDWALLDPKHLDESEFRKVRDEIEQKVKDLLSKL